MKRTAEITLLTVLYVIVTAVASMYIEKEYEVTVIINNSIDSNNTIVREK